MTSWRVQGICRTTTPKCWAQLIFILPRSDKIVFGNPKKLATFGIRSQNSSRTSCDWVPPNHISVCVLTGRSFVSKWCRVIFYTILYFTRQASGLSHISGRNPLKKVSVHLSQWGRGTIRWKMESKQIKATLRNCWRKMKKVMKIGGKWFEQFQRKMESNQSQAKLRTIRGTIRWKMKSKQIKALLGNCWRQGKKLGKNYLNNLSELIGEE